MPLSLSRLHFPVTTLGPGRRLCIWFQGCSIRCAGCISLDTWAPDRHGTSVQDLLSAASEWIRQANGLTVSGGEPFDQPDALYHLLRGFRERSPADVLVYSGYALEKIDLKPFDGLIDALISDPFLVDRPQTLALRGSDNQRLNCLTALGSARFAQYERLLKPEERTLDVMFDGPNQEVFLAGIPRRGDMKRLATLLESQGHLIGTTEDARELE
ncbi:MAG: 4Fe-4S single cluster domain-containing protein [Acidimicrobiia bacterium]